MTALTGDWEDAEGDIDADLTLVRGGTAKESGQCREGNASKEYGMRGGAVGFGQCKSKRVQPAKVE